MEKMLVVSPNFLAGNDPSNDGSTYVAEGDYSEFKSPPSTVGARSPPGCPNDERNFGRMI